MSRALLLAVLLVADVTPKGDVFRPESAKLAAAIQTGRSPIISLAFARDARRLAVLTMDGKLSLWDLSARREIRKVPGPYFSSRIRLSADGSKALAPAADRKSVRLVDLEKGVELRKFESVQASYPESYALSPDGRRVALHGRDHSVRVFDAGSGEELKTLIEPDLGQGGSMAWSPDGKTLAVHGWDSKVRLFDPATGALTGSFAEMGQTPIFMSFSPDSSTLVHVTQEARLKHYDRTGRALRTFEEVLGGSRIVAWSADGRYMAAAEIAGRVRIWEAKTWRPLRDFDAGVVRNLAFSPDGRFLAVGSIDGVVRLWGRSGTVPAKLAEPRSGAPGYLGITGDTAEGGEKGTMISGVMPGTAAERAGLREGDLILKLGTTVTETFESLRSAVMSLREGDEIEITYKRDGAEKKVKLRLGARPADE